MKKNLSRKPARATQNVKFEMSTAMQARMEKAMISIGNIAGKQARKDDKVQREARLAIAETFDAWIDWLEDEAPDQIEEMFFELGCFATATNRRRMFKHAKAPEGVADRAQKQVDQWKEEDEAAKIAAADAATHKTDDARNNTAD
jgi:hypothetical protein